MVRTRFGFMLLLVSVTAATINGAQRAIPTSTPNRPFPPGLQTVSETESPVLSPAAELQKFFMPPGYRLELVASEPMVQDPIAIDWDLEGRLWVIEMPGYMRDILMSRQFDPDGRIVVLEDTDNDGMMDKRTVFADHLTLARSLKVLDHGVLVAEPPNVWLLHDTNGDLQVDSKELVTSNYGQRDASIEHNANSFFWAMDNWMHTANGDVDLRLKNGVFEVRRVLTRGQWGVTQNDAGRIFRNTNESALHVDLVPTEYFTRNPAQTRTRGSYETLAGDDDELNVVWPARPTWGVNRGYQQGILRADGRLAKFTSSSSPTIYRGDRLPADLYGNVFIAEPAGNTVARIILSDDGTALRARKAYAEGEFITTTDERFRPTALSNAPDGTLYVVDMYRGLLQQRSDISEYLRGQILSRKLERPTGLGRIFRVVHESTTRGPKPSLTTASADGLVASLSHPNGWWRDTAQRLLVERNSVSVAPALTNLVLRATDWRVRLQALWTLDGIDAVEPATVTAALDDASADVRAAAIRVSERWLGQPAHPIQQKVVALVEDGRWAVRYQLAASVGVLPSGMRETAVVALLDRAANDPVVMDATLSGLRGAELSVLEKLLQAFTTQAQTPQREAAITMFTAAVVRGAQDGAVQGILSYVATETAPAWMRAAVLRGAEVTLLNAAMPGTPGRRGGAAGANGVQAPCPTCPGARGGPGGAYAFPGGPTAAADQFVHPGTNARGDVGVARPAAPVAPAGTTTAAAGAAPAATQGGGRGGGAGGLRLNREPATFATLAAAGADLSARATALLARISWPGKPGAVVIEPLTPDEERRFDAGAEIYKTICAACHQLDGRGQEKVAPALVGSRFALAVPEVGARIVLHGKTGSIGVMPPLGTALSDEQIAGVLTYIRREWGQAGSPVEPTAIRGVRALTAGRTRAWTEDELTTVGQ